MYIGAKCNQHPSAIGKLWPSRVAVGGSLYVNETFLGMLFKLAPNGWFQLPQTLRSTLKWCGWANHKIYWFPTHGKSELLTESPLARQFHVQNEVRNRPEQTNIICMSLRMFAFRLFDAELTKHIKWGQVNSCHLARWNWPLLWSDAPHRCIMRIWFGQYEKNLMHSRCSKYELKDKSIVVFGDRIFLMSLSGMSGYSLDFGKRKDKCLFF